MPDLSMCEGKDCPLKNNCYRHTAISDKYLQSWLMHDPYDKEQKRCGYFIADDVFKEEEDKDD